MAGMEDKLCIITGATSGIGLMTAQELAAKGARLVLVGRDRLKGEAALRQIRARTPAAQIEVLYADLSRLSELQVLAERLQALPRIDVLINNAGAIFWRRQT